MGMWVLLLVQAEVGSSTIILPIVGVLLMDQAEVGPSTIMFPFCGGVRYFFIECIGMVEGVLRVA